MCKKAWSDGKKAFIRNDSIVVNGVSCKAYPPSSPVAGHISSNSDTHKSQLSLDVSLSNTFSNLTNIVNNNDINNDI